VSFGEFWCELCRESSHLVSTGVSFVESRVCHLVSTGVSFVESRVCHLVSTGVSFVESLVIW
jgi:hypothetical protein